jgi:hydrogenase maturation protease
MKTLVIGLGNPILCDDGVGIRVARELAARVHSPDVIVEETGAAGMDCVEILAGYQRAIIIDAVYTGRARPGEIIRLAPDDLNSTLHSASLHDISLSQAIEMGRQMGAKMPQEIIIFGIEVADTTTFSESCTPGVESAIPECVERVLDELKPL